MKTTSDSKSGSVWAMAVAGLASFVSLVELAGADHAPAASTPPPRIFTERPPPPSAVELSSASQAQMKPSVPLPEKRPTAILAEIERLQKECDTEEAELLRERVEFLRTATAVSGNPGDIDFTKLEKLQRTRVERLKSQRKRIEAMLAAHRGEKAASVAPSSGTANPPSEAAIGIEQPLQGVN